MYMVLILPTLFGLTLVGDGIHKAVDDDMAHGVLSIAFGIGFILVVIFAFIFFASYFRA